MDVIKDELERFRKRDFHVKKVRSGSGTMIGSGSEKSRNRTQNSGRKSLLKLTSLGSQQNRNLGHWYACSTQLVKLSGSHSISRIGLRIGDLKRQKMVRTINIHYNNRSVAAVVDLKARVATKIFREIIFSTSRNFQNYFERYFAEKVVN
jgi:hypothetical protein